MIGRSKQMGQSLLGGVLLLLSRFDDAAAAAMVVDDDFGVEVFGLIECLTLGLRFSLEPLGR